MNILSKNLNNQLTFQDQKYNTYINSFNEQFLSHEEMYYVFCYGSNSVEQLKKRVNNNNLKAYKAYLEGYVRFFAGYSKKWDGGVCSIMKTENEYITKGSIVKLTEDELKKLDKFEGACKDATPYGRVNNVYYRKHIIVKNELDYPIECVVYIRNDPTWIKPPSDDYLKALKNNLSPFWSELDEDKKIIIFDHQLNQIGEFN